MIIINRVIYYNIDNMSLEFIRNSFYEKPVKDINMMIELNTKKGTFEFVKSLIMKSKAKWSIINFDILFYRYLKNTKENAVNQINHCFILTIEALEQFKSILKEKETILFIGLDLLSKEFFDKVLVELSYNKMSSVLFVKSQHIKEKLRKMSDFLLMSTQSSKIKDGFLNKIEVLNLNRGTKEVLIFEYEGKNNEICCFKQMNFYSNEYKDIFEPKAKIIDHNATFNLKTTEQDLKSKNEVSLPFIKSEAEKKKENLIEIDQEDLDELYEEDPDEDLDI